MSRVFCLSILCVLATISSSSIDILLAPQNPISSNFTMDAPISSIHEKEPTLSNISADCCFLENRGQLSNAAILFYYQSSDFQIAFLESSIWITQYRKDPFHAPSIGHYQDFESSGTDLIGNQMSVQSYSYSTVVISFIDSCSVVPLGIPTNMGIVNFITRGPLDTIVHSNIGAFDEIIYNEIYQGIDLRFNLRDGFFKYEFAIDPGYSPESIKLHIEGHRNLVVTDDEVRIATVQGDIIDTDLYVFYSDSPTSIIQSHMTKYSSSEYGFTIPEYDHSRKIIIDPIIYSSYIGGLSKDVVNKVACDQEGDTYLTGETMSPDFPVTPGALNGTFSGTGVFNPYVMKLNGTTGRPIFSTFFGFSGDSNAICIDQERNIYITGSTKSMDFPSTPDALKKQLDGINNRDSFVIVLNSTGNALIYSTLWGGRDGEIGRDVALGEDGTIFFNGITLSPDYPTSENAYGRSWFGGWSDCFVCAIAANRSLSYSTLIGGSDNEECTAIAVDSNGNSYTTGWTYSNNLSTTDNAVQKNNKGMIDSYILKLNAGGSSLLYSTYIGGNHIDYAYDICLDPDTNMYITGTTLSLDYPITPDALQSTNYNGSAFVTGLSRDGSQYRYSTFIGGPGGSLGQNAVGTAIEIAGKDKIFIVGDTRLTTFPISKNAHQKQFGGGEYDSFLVEIMANGSFFSTYIGGNATETSTDVAISSDGKIVLVGSTTSPDFPLTEDAFDTILEPNGDGYIVWYFIDSKPPVADAGPNISIGQFKTAELDGSRSMDEFGISNYSWTIHDSIQTIVLYGPRQYYQFGYLGNFSVILNVSDTDGNWALDELIVNVIDDIPPEAEAGPDIYIDQHEEAFLSGSGSHDNNEIVNLTWSFIYGNISVELYGWAPSFMFHDVGVYRIGLTVSDRYGNTGFAQLNVTVRDVTPPTAYAGADLVVPQGSMVILNGTGSHDNVGISSWRWSFWEAGMEQILLGPVVEYYFENAGEYNISLTVIDVNGLTSSDWAILKIVDTEDPRAVAGPDIQIDQFQNAVFNGSASRDNMGIVHCAWSFTYDDLPITLDGMEAFFLFDLAGSYIVQMNVSDLEGNWAVDSLEVTVDDITPPMANAGPDVDVDQSEEVMFDANGSSDNVGIVKYEWTFEYNGSIVRLEGSVQSFVFRIPGTYSIQLTVWDLAGNEGHASHTVSVRDTEPPTAEAGGDHIIKKGQTVEFDGLESSDNVGIVNWTWKLDNQDGIVLMYGPQVSFRFRTSGIYHIELIVRDDAGLIDTDIITIEVQDGGIDSKIAISIGVALIVIVSITIVVRKYYGKHK